MEAWKRLEMINQSLAYFRVETSRGFAEVRREIAETNKAIAAISGRKWPATAPKRGFAPRLDLRRPAADSDVRHHRLVAAWG